MISSPVSISPTIGAPQAVLVRASRSSFLRKYVGRPYLAAGMWIWRHLPTFLISSRPARAYGAHLHTLIQLRATRTQSVGTFFFRNRPELDLLVRLLDQKAKGSILDVALNHGIHLEHACGGNCACTTCHVWVKEGAENLSEMDDDEADRLDMAADLQLNSRLGCQAVITKTGKIVVEIPAWNRNYVSEEH